MTGSDRLPNMAVIDIDSHDCLLILMLSIGKQRRGSALLLIRLVCISENCRNVELQYSCKARELYMCMPKVANPRDKRELTTRAEGDEIREVDEWLFYRPYQTTQSGSTSGGAPAMLSVLNREREMSAMVSALTHVVSGEVADESDLTPSVPSPPSGTSYSSSSPLVEVGRKREREDEGGGGELREPVTKLCTAFGDFTHGGSGSSSGVRGKLLYF